MSDDLGEFSTGGTGATGQRNGVRRSIRLWTAGGLLVLVATASVLIGLRTAAEPGAQSSFGIGCVAFVATITFPANVLRRVRR